jgi:hypothetical protein
VVEFIYNICIIYKNMSGIPDIHEEPMILKYIDDKNHLYNIVSQQLRKRSLHSDPPTPYEIMRVINDIRKSRHLPKLYLDTNPGDLNDYFGLVRYQDVLTLEKIPHLSLIRNLVTENMDSIPLQCWVNAKVANGSHLYKLIKQINRIRKEKGFKPVFLTKVGYNSIQDAHTDQPSWNYTTDPSRRFIYKEESEHIGRKHTRKALKGFQKMSGIGVFDTRLWGNTGGPFENYLRTKRSRSNSKSSRSEESSDFSSENSANSNSSRRTKKARK